MNRVTEVNMKARENYSCLLKLIAAIKIVDQRLYRK